MSKLIILRGNSGSGKTTIAKEIQKNFGRNTMLISQDVIRRDMLRVKDGENTEAISLMKELLAYGREHSDIVILEGIMYADWYKPLFELAIQLYDTKVYAYYFDIPFEETLKRHQTKPNCSAILNHVGKNKDKVRIFKKDVSESTVFSFLDLVFYAYSFFPNYNNTQKLLSIISYVRDEYDIFSKSRSLQNLLNKYAFVFEKANLNDIVDLFLFCAQAEIEIPYVEEERIVKKLYEKDDPILWATYLLYSKYNEKYYNDIKTTIEQILAKRIEAIRVQKSIFEYREFWWVLVFNKCPLLSSTSQILINGVINSLPYTGTGNRNCADIALDVFVDYLKNNGEQFFEWDMSRKDFLRTITFKTHEKSIFKNYKESVASLVWGSI